MSFWISCNSCFLSPANDRKLALTSCGHVICNVCYGKGKPGSCLICNARCKIAPLSDKSSTEVKALFSDLSVVAKKYLKEISEVITFQSGHKRRLLAYYQQKNEKQKEALIQLTNEIQHMTKKLNEQSAFISKLENSLQHQSYKISSVPRMSQSPYPTHGQQAVPVFQIPRSSPMVLSRHPSVTDVTDKMEIEGRNLFGKQNNVSKVSLINTSRNRQIEMFPRRPSSQVSLANRSIVSASISRSQGLLGTPDTSFSPSPGWKSPTFRPPTSFRHSMSSLVCSPP
ncbi:putative E3 SUMO-protein ligase RNF212 [Nelusetta ayraudi]|uniref:putative E3 SUMO-protein ligase RNF212 n=1 Tax=Nelusetta ayraudi TaxID=303726 RepID=UPI003F6F8B96